MKNLTRLYLNPIKFFYVKKTYEMTKISKIISESIPKYNV